MAYETTPTARLVVALLTATACTKSSAGSEGQTSSTTIGATSSEGSEGSTGSASTEDSTSGSISGSISATASCNILCEPDVGTDEPCSPWLQDCPRGQKCAASSPIAGSPWIETACTPVSPSPDAVGEPCHAEDAGYSGVDTCALGSMCWNVDTDSGIGECVAQCKGDEWTCTSDPKSCCPPGTTCTIGANAALILCLPG